MLVTAIEHDRVFGTLDSDPATLKRLRMGQRISFELSQLDDWLCKEDGALHGGFTIAVLAMPNAGRRGANPASK